MQKNLYSKVAAVFIFALAPGVMVMPARADNFGKRITLSIAPNYEVSANGDYNAPPPAGRAAFGYTNDHPGIDVTGLDYGLDYRLNQANHFYYTHTTISLAVGRVLSFSPKLSYVSGLLFDRVDTIGINHYLTKDVNLRAFYFDHSRIAITGQCASQQYCASAKRGKFYNPRTIDEHGYDAGISYGVGPVTNVGRLLTFTGDVKYVPRDTVGPRNPDGTPAYSLEGLGAYTGSILQFPYSVQIRLPFFYSRTFVPFVGYARTTSRYRGESTQQLDNAISYGFTKVFSKNLFFNVTDIGKFGCRCTSTVPTPDNIRWNTVEAKLDFHFTL